MSSYQRTTNTLLNEQVNNIRFKIINNINPGNNFYHSKINLHLYMYSDMYVPHQVQCDNHYRVISASRIYKSLFIILKKSAEA